MKQLLVIGANGKVGRRVCRMAAERKLLVRPMIRSADQAGFFRELGWDSVVFDLEGDFEAAFEDCDRVVFTAGSGGHTGGDKTLLVDLYAAIRAIDMAVRAGIEHFVMVSSLSAGNPLQGPERIRHYLVAKMVADEHLGRSGLTYTVLRPGGLTEDPGSGRIRIARNGESSPRQISRDNVAACVLASLESEWAINRTVDLLDGEVPIEEVFHLSPAPRT